MVPLGARLLAIAGMAALLGATATNAVISDPAPNSLESNRMEPPPVGGAIAGPRTGLICVWGIYVSLLEVGKHCEVPRNPAFEAALTRAVVDMEEYARRRSPEGAAFMASYRAQRLEKDASLCRSDGPAMYHDMSMIPPEMVRSDTEWMLAASPPGRMGHLPLAPIPRCSARGRWGCRGARW